MIELRTQPADLIAGQWRPLTGDAIRSINPARPGEPPIWCAAPDATHVDEAVAAARSALGVWARWSRERRFAVLRRFQELAREHADALAELISDETGKALWDARGEAGALAAKVDITLEESFNNSLTRVTGFDLDLTPTRVGRCWFRPHGVMAVIGPYNFPAHLPNGHIIPALAMGNTVVLKPSDKAPMVGQALVRLYQTALDEAGAPPGVVNLVHGAGDIAASLVSHDGIDGILFTGSWPVGRRILEANLDRPGRIVALEMGGNNPMVVMPDADLRQAAIECVRAAFVTTGQRCTCTRRLIVHEQIADRLIPAIIKAASNLVIAPPRAAHPVFCGPIISAQAREAVLAAQQRFVEMGGRVLLEARAADDEHGGYYITPGIIEVDRFVPEESSDAGCDIEVFGPLLRVSRVGDLDEAIVQANATRYGLASAIFTREKDAVEAYLARARAGCINVNAGTAGASSRLPFGGLGLSGNHRPAGSFSLDYCAVPIAGLIESSDSAALPPGMTIKDDWLT